MNDVPIQRALISVSDKLGIVDLARGLVAAGVEIYSTGGTRHFLEDEHVPVQDVADYTGFPEMLDGRVKTLHPKIFGGILARGDNDEDAKSLADHGILSFGLVVVNLYPFEATIARPGVSDAEAVEKIDIGGPSLIRAAAKNHQFVAVATHPGQYSAILDDIEQTGGTSYELRRRLMVEAFAHTAQYDTAIAAHFSKQASTDEWPRRMTLTLKKKSDLRYGENPHQSAALYSLDDERGANVVSARQLHGKELSYNNYIDLDAALTMVRQFGEPACVVIKHTNPCGMAVGDTLVEAVEKALAGDPQSAFGSVLAINRTLDAATAELLSTPGLFVEAILAPDFAAGAFGTLTTVPKWKNNVRLMQLGRMDVTATKRHFRHIEGGMLIQDCDTGPDLPSQWRTVTQTALTDDWRDEIRFAWSVVRGVKSNAIVITNDRALRGAGAGQMSRVDSVEIAIKKAGDWTDGGVLASDAFFPFPDSIERAAQVGIAAIIQPGGSVKDDEVIAAADAAGIPMIFTDRRHFRH